MRRHVMLVSELAPDRELRGVVGAERKGRDDFEAGLAGAERVEQLGRELAELEALPDMPLGDAEAYGDGLDRDAAVDQRRHGGEFVGRVHRGAHRILHKRGFERGVGRLDKARHLAIACDRALGGKLLQGLEPPPPAVTAKRSGSPGTGQTIRFCFSPPARMLALSSASSDADAGLLRTLAGDRTRRSRGMVRTIEVVVMAEILPTGERETSPALSNPPRSPHGPFPLCASGSR